jgi:NAD(P)-dependent dehydrogenase (short-subunit alcohol dehydrogenase family)
VEPNTPRLAGKRAFVSGAGSGIGRAIALRLAEDGAAVAVTDISPTAAEGVRDEIRSSGGNAIARRCDVADEASVVDAVAETIEAFDGLDTVVACAGIAHPATTHEMSLAAWETMLGVNLTGVFLSLKHTIPHLIGAGGGSVVTIGSVASLVAAGQASAYDASKGGVLQLTRAVAIEYVDSGIRANCICPGVVDTDLGRTSRRVAVHAAQSGTRRPPADRLEIPMTRRADPAEIAAAAAFLCSDEASFITGIALPVDGGYCAI